MNRKQIIEIATQVYGECEWHESALLHLELFAELVAAHERELCAKLLDEEAIDAFTFDDSLARATENYAELIRARGQQ